MTNPHVISESDAIRQFGRGIVRLVLYSAILDGVRVYSPSQLARKRDEGPKAYVSGDHRTNGDRVRQRA